MDLINYYNDDDQHSELELLKKHQRGFTAMKKGKYFAWVKDEYVEDRVQVGWVVITAKANG